MGFAERLKELRNETQCTQKQLAKYLGLTPNSICEWENHRSEPSISSIIKISKYFDVTTDYLLSNSDDFGVIANQPGSLYSSEEQRLVEAYRTLSPDLQKMLWEVLSTWMPTTNTKKNRV